MDLEIREARQANSLTEAQKELLKTKDKKIPNKLEIGKWHELLLQIEGDRLTVSIDGKSVGQFTSEGFAHPTKKMLRLSVPRNAVVDDLSIYRKS